MQPAMNDWLPSTAVSLTATLFILLLLRFLG